MENEMESSEKADIIRRWIDPEERVTVDFENEGDLNAEVVECDELTVTVVLETAFPHYKQHLTLPLSMLSVGEDKTHYTRDSEKPLRYGRLRLTVHENRPQPV
jgi:hypothetical protein